MRSVAAYYALSVVRIRSYIAESNALNCAVDRKAIPWSRSCAWTNTTMPRETGSGVPCGKVWPLLVAGLRPCADHLALRVAEAGSGTSQKDSAGHRRRVVGVRCSGRWRRTGRNQCGIECEPRGDDRRACWRHGCRSDPQCGNQPLRDCVLFGKPPACSQEKLCR